MTEDEARGWLEATLRVPRETWEKLDRFVASLTIEAAQQNLIAASTLDTLWARHIVDSAQLLPLAPAHGHWIDVGTGAGFPGLIIAILDEERDVVLVDSRKLRTRFLERMVEHLGVCNVTVITARVETLRCPPAAVVSARAFAPLDTLFATLRPVADRDTVWLLPKGRQAASELDAARKSWQGRFAMHPSVTDPEAAVIVATHVARRAGA